jgi:hypothetical protein
LHLGIGGSNLCFIISQTNVFNKRLTLKIDSAALPEAMGG